MNLLRAELLVKRSDDHQPAVGKKAALAAS
jgi:hypothetical protein